MKALLIIWIPMEVIKNSKEPFVKPKHLIWNGGTDTQTDRQTDPCIELRYAQLNIYVLAGSIMYVLFESKASQACV